jgi:hypothetical protein
MPEASVALACFSCSSLAAAAAAEMQQCHWVQAADGACVPSSGAVAHAHGCMADSTCGAGVRKGSAQASISSGGKEPNAGGQGTMRSGAGAQHTVPAGFTQKKVSAAVASSARGAGGKTWRGGLAAAAVAAPPSSASGSGERGGKRGAARSARTAAPPRVRRLRVDGHLGGACCAATSCAAPAAASAARSAAAVFALAAQQAASVPCMLSSGVPEGVWYALRLSRRPPPCAHPSAAGPLQHAACGSKPKHCAAPARPPVRRPSAQRTFPLSRACCSWRRALVSAVSARLRLVRARAGGRGRGRKGAC